MEFITGHNRILIAFGFRRKKLVWVSYDLSHSHIAAVDPIMVERVSLANAKLSVALHDWITLR